MLRTRVISAIVLFAIIIGPVLAGGLLFWLLVIAIGGLAAWEYTKLLQQGGYSPLFPLALLLTLSFIAQAQWPETLSAEQVVGAAILISLIWVLWHDTPQPATDWALTLSGALYVGWLLGYFVRVRTLEDGLLWLLLAAAGTWAADVTAYFAGRALGRHPWWPRHSPKKTWEGYLAGIAGATLVVGLLGMGLLPMSPLSAMTLGLLIGAVAPLGDLAESMLKRQVGAKDSSHLIPGHGGVLDRIDSLLIAVPLVYFWTTLSAP